MVELQFDKVYYTFLDELRKSGVTNMYGAGQYLVDEFYIDDKKARDVLANWMKTFVERHKEEAATNSGN